MRYFLDTEFFEKGDWGSGSIHLISIGLCCEDGREYYAENEDVISRMAKELKENEFLRGHVLPHLMGGEYLHYPPAIAYQITEFIGEDPDPEIWGYFCDYDWVVFCFLWGAMVNLPSHFPKYCRDLKQLAMHIRVDRDQFPPQDTVAHNALNDARGNHQLWTFLVEKMTAHQDIRH